MSNAYTFEFNVTTLEEIHNILFTLKSNAVGADDISLSMLKMCSPFIDVYILHLINSSIVNEYFPLQWKVALECPIPKVSSPQSISDIRIVNILPSMSKIMEKILYNHMNKYFEDNIIIPNWIS